MSRISQSDLSTYDRLVQEAVASVGQAIGIHVMLLVLERALWTTRHMHEEARLITLSEDEGVSLDGLKALPPDKAELVAHEFTMAIVSTLGRLIGKQLAHQLLEQLEEDPREATT